MIKKSKHLVGFSWITLLFLPPPSSLSLQPHASPHLYLFSRSSCKFFSLTETPENYTVVLDEEGFKGKMPLFIHIGQIFPCRQEFVLPHSDCSSLIPSISNVIFKCKCWLARIKESIVPLLNMSECQKMMQGMKWFAPTQQPFQEPTVDVQMWNLRGILHQFYRPVTDQRDPFSCMKLSSVSFAGDPNEIIGVIAEGASHTDVCTWSRSLRQDAIDSKFGAPKSQGFWCNSHRAVVPPQVCGDAPGSGLGVVHSRGIRGRSMGCSWWNAALFCTPISTR